MAVAGFIIYSSVTNKPHSFRFAPKMQGAQLPASLKSPVVKVSTGPAAGSMPGVPVPSSVPITPSTPYRNIGFTYKNVKAKQVLIRADFTGWKGVPMKRDASGLWSYSAQLIPGEYAYCFT